MIPQSTTLQERLEFYEWALGELQGIEYPRFICHLAMRYYNAESFSVRNIKNLFIELYNTRTSKGDYVLWDTENKGVSEQRIEALQKAIIEVKRKIEEDESNRQMA